MAKLLQQEDTLKKEKRMSSMDKSQTSTAPSRDKSTGARLQRGETARRNSSGSGQEKTLMVAHERQQLIATTAYFRAQQRGFTPGGELEDWLQAEIEVDRLLLGGRQMNESSRSMGNLRGPKKS